MRTNIIIILAGILFAFSHLSADNNSELTIDLNFETNEQIQDTLANNTDSTLETYSLNLFDFDRHKLNAYNKELLNKFVIPRCTAESRIIIIGHNDIIGQAEYNMELSCKRAAKVYDYIIKRTENKLGSIEKSCVGEEEPLYGNELTEGRFYNRTVLIIIRTPVENTEKRW